MKTGYILLLLGLVVFRTLSLQAMPPHPDLVEKYRKEGRIHELNKKMLRMNSRARITGSAAKAYPASGTVKIPVLLVRFATPYDSASYITPADLLKNKVWPDSFVPLIFVAAALFLARRMRVQGFAAMVFLFFAALFVSCGISPEDDSIDFPTDVSLYNKILNGDSSFTLSAKKYFSDMSNGNLDIQFDFFGPVIVSKAWDYYGENDTSGNDLHNGELVSEALRLMVTRYMSTDFSVYDNNDDGDVETVVIIHEGRGEESGAEAETIWSHEYDLSSAKAFGDGFGAVYTDGVKFDKYTIVPEYGVTQGDSTIGVYCHELGHALGLSDLYDTTSATDGTGNWSLMASGSWGGGTSFDGSRPAPLLTWERYKLGGSAWVTITTVTSAGTITVDDIETDPRTAFKVSLKDPAGEQYYILEGKTASSSDQWYVPGSGVIITHINEGIISSYSSANEINNGSSRVHGVTVVEADGNSSLWTSGGDKGAAADLYKQGNTLNDATTPNTKYYTSENLVDKTGVSGVSISGFSSATVPMDVNIIP